MSLQTTEKNILISDYAQFNENTENYVEFEIRFNRIPFDVFKEVFLSFKANASKPIHTKEINIINKKKDGPSFIKTMKFHEKERGTTVFSKKNRLRGARISDEYMDYSINISEEAPIDPALYGETRYDDLVRVKSRLSFDVVGPDSAKWRLDLTLAIEKQFSEIKNSLKGIKKRLFDDLTADKFLDDDQPVGIKYEIELEFNDVPSRLRPESLDIVKKIFESANPRYIDDIKLQNEYYEISRYIHESVAMHKEFKNRTNKFKRLVNQVRVLDKNNYYKEVFPPVGYFVTDKADGLRAFLVIRGGSLRVVNNELREETAKEWKGESDEITIVDAELVDGGKVALVFDVMVFRYENFSKKPYERRVEMIQEACDFINKYFKIVKCRPKKILQIMSKGDLKKVFTEIISARYDYKNEGVILTEPGKSYENTINYKIKERSETTIDFYAKKCPEAMLGLNPFVKKEGRTLYLLFNGISHQTKEKAGVRLVDKYKTIFPINIGTSDYYPIQFSPSFDPLAFIYQHKGDEDLNGEIIELSRTDDLEDWIFHRIRVDRREEKNYFGNDFKVAELTYSNYINPFDFESLWEESGGYFTKTAGEGYRAINKFKRFAISETTGIFLKRSKYLIDLASGRGANLNEYKMLDVQNMLFTDIDPQALAELVSRKYTQQRRGGDDDDDINVTNFDKIFAREEIPTVHATVLDLNHNAEDVVRRFGDFSFYEKFVDNIVCNFSFHYLCSNVGAIKNALTYISRMLKKGGRFTMTVPNGERIFNLLKDVKKGETMNFYEGDTRKYAIKKLYDENKIADAGQMIEYWLDLSSSFKPEPLCNISYVKKEAAALKLKCASDVYINSFLPLFEKIHADTYKKTSATDRENSGLFNIVVFEKR